MSVWMIRMRRGQKGILFAQTHGCLMAEFHGIVDLRCEMLFFVLDNIVAAHHWLVQEGTAFNQTGIHPWLCQILGQN